jgi:hypothetical protein
VWAAEREAGYLEYGDNGDDDERAPFTLMMATMVTMMRERHSVWRNREGDDDGTLTVLGSGVTLMMATIVTMMRERHSVCRNMGPSRPLMDS